MRSVTYAGQTIITTDDVAEALVELTAALANNGRAEAVRFPIVIGGAPADHDAELVIGVGHDVLSAPVEWTAAEPDFSAASAELRAHWSYPRRSDDADRSPDPIAEADTYWDPDLQGFTHA